MLYLLSPFDEPQRVTGLDMLNPAVPHADLQFSDFNVAISASETELAKWEGYPALVTKMRRDATLVSLHEDGEDCTNAQGGTESESSDAEVRVDSSRTSTLMLLR